MEQGEFAKSSPGFLLHFPPHSTARNQRSLSDIFTIAVSLYYVLQGARIHQKGGYLYFPFRRKANIFGAFLQRSLDFLASSRSAKLQFITSLFLLSSTDAPGSERGKVSSIASFPTKTKLTCHILGFSKEQKRFRSLRLHFFLRRSRQIRERKALFFLLFVDFP